MKKNYWILAAAAVALAACSNDDTITVNQGIEEANTINFRALTSNMTRARNASFSAVGDAFKVTAFPQGTTGTAYFANVEFKTADGSTFTSQSNKYYWPSGTNLDFYAWAPSDIENATYSSIPVTVATAAADQIDFVYAATKDWGKVALQTNTDPSHAIAATPSSGVAINFRHALSKIVIKIKNSNANLKITASNATLNNVIGVGTFVFADDKTDVKNSGLLSGGWTSLGDATAVYSQDITPAVFGATAAQAGTDLKLIPQELVHGNAYASAGTEAVFTAPNFVVKLKIQNSADDNYIVGAPSGENQYVDAMFPLPDVTWLPGKQYTYVIDLANGGYYTKNQDTSDDLDPILEGAEIKFVTVTVDDWDTTAADTEVVAPANN